MPSPPSPPSQFIAREEPTDHAFLPSKLHARLSVHARGKVKTCTFPLPRGDRRKGVGLSDDMQRSSLGDTMQGKEATSASCMLQIQYIESGGGGATTSEGGGGGVGACPGRCSLDLTPAGRLPASRHFSSCPVTAAGGPILISRLNVLITGDWCRNLIHLFRWAGGGGQSGWCLLAGKHAAGKAFPFL